jgi:hypothetical protein
MLCIAPRLLVGVQPRRLIKSVTRSEGGNLMVTEVAATCPDVKRSSYPGHPIRFRCHNIPPSGQGVPSVRRGNSWTYEEKNETNRVKIPSLQLKIESNMLVAFQSISWLPFAITGKKREKVVAGTVRRRSSREELFERTVVSLFIQ